MFYYQDLNHMNFHQSRCNKMKRRDHLIDIFVYVENIC